MRFALRTLLPAILLATAVLACNAATYYVSTDGDNSNPGTAQLPWRSIDAGDSLGLLLPGDVVVVKEGVYVLEDDASISLAKCSGVKGCPITYKADGLVVVQGSVESKSVGFQVSASYTTLTGFRIRSLSHGIRLAAGTTGNTVAYCSMSDIGAAGIHDQGGKDNLLHHNLFYNVGLASGDGPSTCVLASACEGLKVFNNTMASFDEGILAQNASAGAVEAVNNIIFGMRTFGLGSSNSEPGSIANSNNIFHENAADADSTIVLGAASLVADPEFVSPEAHDYRVGLSSVAIDAGKDVGLAFEGSAPDIGAFETARASAASADKSANDDETPAPKPGLVALSTVSLTYYVSTSGNDSNDGLTTSTAWATIERGDVLKILRPGDTVIVAAGTYVGSSYYGIHFVNCSGTAAAPITYRTTTGAVIDRDSWHNPAPGNNTLAFGVSIEANYTVLDGFEIKNAQYGIVDFNGKQGNQIINCKIHDMTAPNTTADSSSQAGWCAGIDCWLSKNLTIRNNVFHDIGDPSSTNDAACVVIMGGDDVKVHNNTCDIARFGLHGAVYVPSNVEAKNNIFSNVRATAISSYYATVPNFVHTDNLYYSNTADFGTGVTASTPEYFNLNPKYTNAGSHDYHLLQGSPGINAGTDLGYTYTGSAPDLGAYESGYASATTYYVKPAASGGNDGNNGTSIGTAWATINRGDVLGVLNSGDTVRVSAGTYAQPTASGVILVNCSGSASAPITYYADGSVVITQSTYNATYGVSIGSSYLVIDGFEIRNSQYGVYLAGGSGSGGSNCEIKNCKIHDIRPQTVGMDMWLSMAAGIYNSYGDNNTFHHNAIYEVGDTSHPTSSGNNNWAFCYGGPAGSNNKLYNNTLCHAWGGVMAWGSGSGNLFKNNITTNHWSHGFRYGESAGLWTNSYNLYYSNTANYSGNASAGTSEQTANPSYVNLGTYDLHLQSASPAINSGIDLGLGWSYYGSAPDEGAYEYDSSTTYYVKTNGNDALDGTSLANAWLHINRGDVLGVLKAGDTVIVAAGTYSELSANGIQFANCSGNPYHPITYQANGAAVIDQDSWHNPAPDNNTSAFAVTVQTNYTVLDGFEIKNAQFGIADWNGKQGNQIINCKIHDMTPPNTTADNSTQYGWCGGIDAWLSRDMIVRNNVFYNIGYSSGATQYNDASCIVPMGGDNIKIHNNTCVGARFGLHGAVNVTLNVEAKNNIFSDMRSSAISSYYAESTYVGGLGFVHSHNLFYNNSSNYGSGVFPGTAEWTANPRYTDAGSHDYHLLTGSPAINTGTDLGYSYTGSAPDLGAFETASTWTATTYYVKTNGNDNLDGKSLANAWAHIDRGDVLGVLNPGDTVRVSAGTYAQPTASGVYLVNCSGNSAVPITYYADGAVLITQSSYNATYGFSIGASYLVVDGFEIQNSQYGIYLAGVSGNAASSCEIKNCRIHDILPQTGDSEDQWLSMAAGIYISYGDNNELHNNVISNVGTPHLVPTNGNNNWSFCIGGAGASNTKVYNNTLVHAWAGIMSWVEGYGNQLQNNIIYDTWGYGFRNAASVDSWTNSHNLYYNTSGVTYGDYASAGVNEQNANPVFGAYFVLQASSPAINAGVDVGYSYNGAAPDEGAYETAYTTSVYYVATTGSDANAGTAASPWLHINHGDVDGHLKPGDAVIVSPGTYVPADYWGVKLQNCSGAPGAPITYRANGAVCINQTGVSKPTYMSFGIYANVNYVTFDGFEIKGSQWGVYSNDSKHDNTVMNCVIHDLIPGNANASDWYGWCGGVYFSANSSGTAHHNATYNIGTSGVDKRAAGLCVPSSTNIKLYNNTCVNAWAGLSIWGSGSSGIQAVNNAFTNNWKYGIHNEDVSGCLTHTNNIFYSNTTANYGGNVSASTGEFNADPVYVNYSTRDLRLQDTSPAIDSGVDVQLSYLGASPDMGAYENSSGGVHNWVVSKFEGTAGTARPFSFYYNGSAANISSWTYTYSSTTLDANRVERTNTYTAPDGKLQVRCVSTEYLDFPAVDWVVYFKNIAGSGNTYRVSNIYGCNMSTYGGSTTGTFNIHWVNGGEGNPDAFQPYTSTLNASSTLSWEPPQGIPSYDMCPFFNLVKPNGNQMLIGLGWSGTWNTSFTRDAGYNVTVRTGLDASYVDCILDPGREIRTPRTVMLLTSGSSWIDGQNLWRQFVIKHYSPTTGGAPYDLPVSASVGVNAPQDVDGVLGDVSTIVNYRLPVDVIWNDAGYYHEFTPGEWSAAVGNYEADTERFPNGMRPVADAAHAAGMKYLLWFEFEGAANGTWMWNTYPQWLLPCDLYPNSKQVDLGNPYCLAWAKDFYATKISNWDLDIFRIDMNGFPRMFWDANPIGDDWHGIRENMFIQGLYSFLDHLQSSRPDLLIDNCAGGGRRIDLEMMKRSVAFWRCDRCWHDHESQNMELGLAPWCPLTGLGAIGSVSPYHCRSGLGTYYILGLYPWQMGDFGAGLTTRVIDEFRSVKDYFYGDFYPTGDYSLSNDTWMAWQWNRSDLGKGILVAFRRPGSATTSNIYYLKGLEPDRQYSVTNKDTGVTLIKTGTQLMNSGVTVSLPTLEWLNGEPYGASALYFYEEL